MKMSKAVKGTNSMTPRTEASLLGVASAVLPAPEIKGTDAEPVRRFEPAHRPSPRHCKAGLALDVDLVAVALVAL